MLDEISRLWWLFGIRGLFSLTFAYICFLLSSTMQTVLLRPAGFVSMQVLFSFYIVAAGFTTLTGALFAYDVGLKHRHLLLINGLVGVGIGAALFALLTLPLSLVALLFGLHALFAGVFYAVIAYTMRAERANGLLLGLAGLCSAIAGAAFIALRGADMLQLTRGIGWYSAFFGALVLLFSLSLRRAHKAILPALKLK